jgi:hypothetical protein
MRLHFTIRDLLWLTALLAMGLAWWVDHRALSRPPAYTLKVAKDDFIITDTKTGLDVLRIDKDKKGAWQAWRRQGQAWLIP